jgi:hypothetical protein
LIPLTFNQTSKTITEDTYIITHGPVKVN